MNNTRWELKTKKQTQAITKSQEALKRGLKYIIKFLDLLHQQLVKLDSTHLTKLKEWLTGRVKWLIQKAIDVITKNKGGKELDDLSKCKKTDCIPVKK